MNWQRLAFMLLSGAALAGLAYVSARSVASLEVRIVQQAQASLEVAGTAVTQDLEVRADRLERWAYRLQESTVLPTALRTLRMLVTMVPAGGDPGDRLRERINGVRSELDTEIASLRADSVGLEGIALIDVDGVVLHSGTPMFRAGDAPVVVPPAVEGEAARGAIAVPNSTAPASVSEAVTLEDAIKLALAGQVRSTVVVAGDGLRIVAATPLMLRGRPSGAALLVRRVTALAVPVGLSSFLVAHGKVVLGAAPEGFVPPTRGALPAEKPQAQLLQVREARARLGTLGDIGAGPWLMDRGQVGLWATQFRVPAAKGVSGYVFVDVEPAIGELGGIQVLVVITALLVWILHVVMLGLSGRRLRVGVNRMADFLGRVQQGKGDGKPLDERKFVPEFRRLVVLINKLASQGQSVQDLQPLSSAPSIDDVLRAHGGESSHGGDLEFEGISGSGTFRPPAPFVAVEEPTQQMPLPPELRDADESDLVDADGYESLGEVTDAMITGVDDAELDAELVDELPSVAETDAAVAHFAPEPSGPALPAAPAPPKQRIGDLLDEFAPDATVVRPLSKDEIVRLHTVAERPVEPKEAEYRRVYEAFVAAREQCGESAVGLTYEKFVTRLHQSRDAVIAKHGCADVSFEVYVKEGRAALKATPAR